MNNKRDKQRERKESQRKERGSTKTKKENQTQFLETLESNKTTEVRKQSILLP
jgi:hypothetical protein